MQAADYQQQLLNLLPPGPAWTSDPNDHFVRLLYGLAEELAKADASATGLIDEADPRTTYYMLSDWERLCGLPRACAPLSDTLQGRRDAVLAALTGRGGQSRQYFVDLARSIGFDISIREMYPYTVGMSVDAPLYDESWRFAWQVNAPSSTVITATVTSGVDEPLKTWGNAMLECAMGGDKPAQSAVQFAYDDALFTWYDVADAPIGTGDGSTKAFLLNDGVGGAVASVKDELIFLDGVMQTSGYVIFPSGVLMFDIAPASGVVITASFSHLYQLDYIGRLHYRFRQE